MVTLYDFGILFGYFIVMILFLIIAVVFAKNKGAWAWYSVGAIIQLMSLIGTQKTATMYGDDISYYWLIYFLLLIITAWIIRARYLKFNTNSADVEKKTKIHGTGGTVFTVCVFDATTQTLRQEKKIIDVTKFPPSKFADNDTYYAIETFRDEKKVRIYYTKENWEKKRKKNTSQEVTIVDDNEKQQEILYKEQGTIFCRKCGAKIVIDSIFCSKCGTRVEEVNKNYFVCIFDTATHTLCKEKKNIDVTKFPPSKFADNDTYYAIETFRDGKKVRIYHTKDNWNKQIEIGISEEGK